MKSKDYALIGASVILSAIISIFVSKLLFSSSTAGQQVDIVPSISSKWPSPDPRYFNNSSIDLTQFISIGNNSNPNPFGTSNSSGQ